MDADPREGEAQPEGRQRVVRPGGTLSGYARPLRRPSARIDSGASHVGLRFVSNTAKGPVGVLQSARPTATGNASTGPAPVPRNNMR